MLKIPLSASASHLIKAAHVKGGSGDNVVMRLEGSMAAWQPLIPPSPDICKLYADVLLRLPVHFDTVAGISEAMLVTQRVPLVS